MFKRISLISHLLDGTHLVIYITNSSNGAAKPLRGGVSQVLAPPTMNLWAALPESGSQRPTANKHRTGSTVRPYARCKSKS